MGTETWVTDVAPSVSWRPDEQETCRLPGPRSWGVPDVARRCETRGVSGDHAGRQARFRAIQAPARKGADSLAWGNWNQDIRATSGVP